MINEKPFHFADIHNHMLFGADDGAKTEQEMQQMIDAAYTDGVRHLCFTPHYHPGYFGEHQKQIKAAFEKAEQYVVKQYPDLMLYLGNELRYERSCVDWLEQERCQTLNNTNYLLVDFLYSESVDSIMDAMLRVLNAGYSPVLAHVERYEKFNRNLQEIERLKSWGVIIQVDAQSPLGGLGHASKMRSRRLLDAYMVDLIASDAHDLKHCPPKLSSCCELVSDRWGIKYAETLFWGNPMRILSNKEL